MVIHVEFVLFHGFHEEISWIKVCPGPHSGGLGALPLGDGGGAKHSPLTGAHENHETSFKIIFLKIIRDHPRTLTNTTGQL